MPQPSRAGRSLTTLPSERTLSSRGGRWHSTTEQTRTCTSRAPTTTSSTTTNSTRRSPRPWCPLWRIRTLWSWSSLRPVFTLLLRIPPRISKSPNCLTLIPNTQHFPICVEDTKRSESPDLYPFYTFPQNESSGLSHAGPWGKKFWLSFPNFKDSHQLLKYSLNRRDSRMPHACSPPTLISQQN